MPDAPAHVDLVRIEAQVERRAVDVAPGLVAEVGRDVGLVRALVAREAGVALDAEHGAADRPRVGHQPLHQQRVAGHGTGDDPGFITGQWNISLHGLLKKIGKRYKYYLTTLGRRVATTALKLRELVIIPMLNQPAAA